MSAGTTTPGCRRLLMRPLLRNDLLLLPKKLELGRREAKSGVRDGVRS